MPMSVGWPCFADCGLVEEPPPPDPLCYKEHMASVGVRELRQRASELLRRVQRGETLEITDRGRPVALLTPLPDGGPFERLRRAGEVQSASAALDDLLEPLVLEAGQDSPSAVLARLRSDER